MTDEVKVTQVKANDVDYTRNGFMDVSIKQEYDGDQCQYETMFSLNLNKTSKEVDE